MANNTSWEEQTVDEALKNQFRAGADGVEVVLDSRTGRLVPKSRDQLRQDDSLRPVAEVARDGYAGTQRP